MPSAARCFTPIGDRECPSCCNHCHGRIGLPGMQAMHAPGCPNDGAGLIKLLPGESFLDQTLGPVSKGYP